MDQRIKAEFTRKWYNRIDQSKMTVTAEIYDEESDRSYEVEFPIFFAVCPTCCGKGSYVNPNIDSNGISATEWENEWGDAEREMYANGMYDITCKECDGQRVVPRVMEDILDEDQRRDLDLLYREIHDDNAVSEIIMMEMGIM